jgi:predicted NAD/FAD-binding protein
MPSICSRRGKVGGHCDSHVIDYHGESVTVDLGAQLFHPDTHPIYVTLLEQLGLYDPAHPNAGETIEAPGSLCIFPTAGGKPDFSSSHPLATLPLSLQFAAYTQLARHAVLSDMSWETTVDEWVRSLPVSRSFKDESVYPWTSALIGSPRADALRASARSILQTFALTFPRRTSLAARAPTTRRSACGATCNGCSIAARLCGSTLTRQRSRCRVDAAAGLCKRERVSAGPTDLLS